MIPMPHLDAVPLWIAVIAAVLLFVGSSLTLIGTLGLLRLKSFYERIHAPTLGTSWGTAGIMLASMLLFSFAENRIVLHEVVIGVFIMVTTPVTLMLLGRAALYRDRAEQVPDTPLPAQAAGES